MIVTADEVQAVEFDCCIVGAGPVGLMCALESAEAGLRVLLVDAGNLRSARMNVQQPLGRRTEIVDLARHADLQLTTRRGVGGTSWLWGGRCVTFEPIDFSERDYVPDGEWPIGIEEIRPWQEKAAQHLDCGTATFRSDRPDWAGLGDFEMSNLERWAHQPRLVSSLGLRVAQDPRISVLLDAPLTDLDYAPDGSVAGLVLDRAGSATTVTASSYVLAMGGLEITNFLLAQQRRRPDAFGGVDGPLGRYYMGHATGAIADIVFADPAKAADLDFTRDSGGTYLRRRFTLSEGAQRRHRVLNTSFYLDNPPFYQHEHRNATLSLVFLGIALPFIGRRLLAEGIRLRHVGPPPYQYAAHLRNVLRRPWRAARDVTDVLLHRYLGSVRKPGFILRNDAGRYALHYHAEQLPNPESRIELRTDDDGADVLRIDFRYLEADIDSLLKIHELLDAQLRSAGIGRLEYLAGDAAAVRASAWEQSTDGFHSIGTTRMGATPADGVVDSDCKVYGTDRLYIASSSVFRTAGEANPTFLAACLSVRLAHHLAELRAAQGHAGTARRSAQAGPSVPTHARP